MRIAPRLNIVVRPDPHNAGGRGLLEATVCIFQWYGLSVHLGTQYVMQQLANKKRFMDVPILRDLEQTPFVLVLKVFKTTFMLRTWDFLNVWQLIWIHRLITIGDWDIWAFEMILNSLNSLFNKDCFTILEIHVLDDWEDRILYISPSNSGNFWRFGLGSFTKNIAILVATGNRWGGYPPTRCGGQAVWESRCRFKCKSARKGKPREGGKCWEARMLREFFLPLPHWLT